MRDDFTKATANILAKRAGFRCSNPECSRPTIGAALEGPGVINLGVAAHITAASPDGPRFDSSLSANQRSDPGNGIWLCQNCAKLIDSDPSTFGSNLLDAWKEKAERAAFEALAGGSHGLREHLHTLFSQVTDRHKLLPASVGSILNLSETLNADVVQRRNAVGDVVQWGRLMDGLFAPRPELLASLLESYVSWLTTTAEAFRRRHLPIFWIDGRSGDGKSVLLLQLAASILRFGPDLLIYQAAHADAVPALIDFAYHASNDDRLILIVAEDLHRVTEPEAFSAALKLLLDYKRQRIGILACGPTPEKTAFLCAHASLEATTWTVPPLSSLDLSLFSRWFQTEITPTTALDRAILVEVLFSSNIGSPLSAFARTFAERLRTFGVLETTCRIVAINALDLGAPDALFQSLAERDSIQRLAQADQLHFEWKTESWGPGVRLVHGAIAWKLFKALSADPLRGLSASAQLARTLASVLKATGLPCGFGLRLVASIRTRLGWYLRDAEVFIDANQFLGQLLQQTTDNSVAATFVATEILAEVIRSSGVSVDAAALSVSLRAIEEDSIPPALRLTVSAQLAILESRHLIASQGLRERAEALVVSGEIADVSAITIQTLVERGISQPGILERWILAQRDSDIPKPLLCFALKTLGATANLSAIVNRWIRTKPEAVQEPLAILVGANNDSETVALATEWIRTNPVTPNAASILAPLLRRNINNESIVALAETWVIEHSKEAQVLEVASVLLSAHGVNFGRALEPTLAVLKEHADRPAVANLLAPAIRSFRSSSALLEFALDWLRRNWTASSSAQIVGALLHFTRGTDQTTEVVRSWIASRPENDQVGQIVSSMIRQRRDNRVILQDALSWILRNWDGNTVSDPISTLLNVHSADLETRKVAFDWVAQHPAGAGVQNVISSLINVDADDVRVHGLALRWIEANPSHRFVPQLLSTLLRASPEQPELRQMAVAWIEKHRQMAEAGHLLATLLFVSKGHAEVVGLARAWIAANEHRRHEQHQVLASLIGTTVDKEEWLNHAMCIVRVPRPEGEQPYLLEALANAVPAEVKVAEILRSYLDAKVNGLWQRQAVLDTWLRAGGPSGPALDFVRSILDKGSNHPDRAVLFGIVTRTCARSWKVILDSILADVAHNSPLCYAVGIGLAAARIEYQPFVESIDRWPEPDSAFVWRGILRSRCPSTLFRAQLLQWLRRRRRKRGYGVVLDGIVARTKKEGTFQSTLPAEVVKDLTARLEGEGNTTPAD